MLNHHTEIAPPPAEASGKLRSDGFRPDIQALRAIGIALVVTGHLWPSLLPGGVTALDAFFVVSGYLIGAQLIREHERTGTIRITRFYARRARRLMPAACLVLVCVVVATFFLVPRERWADYAHQVVASALYYQNWLLVPDFSGTIDPANFTALSHYWSLSLEEQFYLCWPWLMLLLFMLRTQRARFAALATLAAVSLALSVYLTALNKGPAYLYTHLRVYEFVIGTALALGGSRFVLPRTASLVAVPIGWAAFLLPTLFIDHYSPYPGALALIPALGTALIIAARAPAGGWYTRLISVAPLQVLGDISYSLYLWHYPFVALAPYVLPDGVLNDWARLGIIVVSLTVAWLSKRLVEDPIRTAPRLAASPRLTFVVMAATAGATCLAGASLLWA